MPNTNIEVFPMLHFGLEKHNFMVLYITIYFMWVNCLSSCILLSQITFLDRIASCLPTSVLHTASYYPNLNFLVPTTKTMAIRSRLKLQALESLFPERCLIWTWQNAVTGLILICRRTQQVLSDRQIVSFFQACLMFISTCWDCLSQSFVQDFWCT